MRILLTNDDGIRAPGIAAMHEALTAEGSGGPLLDRSAGAVSRAPRAVVFPVAPLTVQSATSHGVTFHEPLMVKPERLSNGAPGVAVDARPADCVKLAIANIWPERFGAGDRPELVISGMNAGANCGINVLYSGTVAAALEAAFLGVPSIAVSLLLGAGKPLFEVAAMWARRTIERIVAEGLPRPHECLSINIPCVEEPWGEGERTASGSTQSTRADPGRGAVDPDNMPPIRVCPMNTHGLVDQYERRVSPAGDVYYWVSGHGLDFRGTERGSDVDLLLAGNITVTPLRYDLTKAEAVEMWRGRVERGGAIA